MRLHSYPYHPATILLPLITALTAGAIYGQENGVSTASSSSPGLQVRTVSAYFDYYSATLPNGGFQSSSPLLSDVAGGGSVQVGWAKSTERSNYSFSYTSSLTGRLRYSQLNAWNHALGFTLSRAIAPRWTFAFSVRGDLSSQAQSLFEPTTLSSVASTQTTFDDLASALLASKFANPQLASILTSAPLVESPVRNLLYGQRMFTSGVQTSLSYSYSPRLSLSFQAGAGRSQHVSDDQALGSSNSFLLPNTTTGSAGLGISYSLSPRTQIGGSVTSTRISSSAQDAYTTTTLATFGRALSRRWVVQLHGGAGVTNPVRQTSVQISTRPLPAGGGSLTFKTLEHTFLGSFDRTVSDSYGLGATSTSSAAFAWHWSRPGRRWWMESSLGWQLLQRNGLGDASGWRTTTGFGWTVGSHLALFTQYAYLNYSGQSQTGPYGVDQSAVRVSAIWSPHDEFHR